MPVIVAGCSPARRARTDGLSSALARPRATLGNTCATVTQSLRQHGEDDITLVLIRIRQ
jgi:hypothetical protein